MLRPRNASRSCRSPPTFHCFPTTPRLPYPDSVDENRGSSPLSAVILVHLEAPSRAAALKLRCAPESPAGPTPAFLIQKIIRNQICMSTKFAGGADAAGPQTTLREPLLYTAPCHKITQSRECLMSVLSSRRLPATGAS